MKRRELNDSFPEVVDHLPPLRPSISEEGREHQMISLAIDAAEAQLRNGTASSQVIVHYLKLGSQTTKLEKEILLEQKKLLVAKTEAINSSQRTEELFKNAVAAIKNYSGKADALNDDD